MLRLPRLVRKTCIFISQRVDPQINTGEGSNTHRWLLFFFLAELWFRIEVCKHTIIRQGILRMPARANDPVGLIIWSWRDVPGKLSHSPFKTRSGRDMIIFTGGWQISAHEPLTTIFTIIFIRIRVITIVKSV